MSKTKNKKVQNLINNLKALAVEFDNDTPWVDETHWTMGESSDAQFALVHDGGPMYSVMTNEFGHAAKDNIEKLVEEAGCYMEDYAAWASVIYLNQ